MTRETPLSTLSGRGAARPRSRSRILSPGFPSAKASSTPGSNDTAKSTSITHPSLVTSGSSNGNGRRSSGFALNPLEGYRRLTFMMLDRNIVAVSPASVWRVLSKTGLLKKWNKKPAKRAPALSSRSSLMSIGTLTFRTSTFAARFSISAASLTGAVAISSTGRSGNK